MRGSWPAFEKFLPALLSVGDDLASTIADGVRAKTPVDKSPEPSRPPGTLRDSIQGRMEPTGSGMRIVVDSDDEPILTYIMRGTVAHEIAPVSAKNLRFVVSGGGVVFTKLVHHPGTSPVDIGQDIGGEYSPEWEPQIQAAIQLAVEAIFAG